MEVVSGAAVIVCKKRLNEMRFMVLQSLIDDFFPGRGGALLFLHQ